MTARDKKIPLVGKLLNLSKSDNEHEAKLALIQANEIMEQYNISQAEAMAANGSEAITDWKIEMNRVENIPFQYITMYFRIARFCDGRGVSHDCGKNNRRNFTFYGTDEDFLNFEAVTKAATKFIDKMDKLERERKHLSYPEDQSYIRAYKVGVADGIAAVSDELANEREKRYKKQSASTAMILIRKGDLINKIYPKKLGTHRGSNINDATGYGRGVIHGKSFTPGSRITKSKTKQIKS